MIPTKAARPMPDDPARAAKLAAALAKMDDDLNWRGPNGRTQAHILLPRELAEAVADVIRDVIADRLDSGQRP